MNKEEILNKYKESVSILCRDTNNLDDNSFFDFEEKYKRLFYSNNIVEKSFSNIARIFCSDSLMYSMPCLFYRNNIWYKYTGNHPQQIQLNNAIELTNTELFKLIKRTLFNTEKNYITNLFLSPQYELNLEELNINKRHLIEFKNMTIESETYQETKIVLEYLLTIEEKFIVY